MRYRCGSTPLSLHVSISEAMAAQASAPFRPLVAAGEKRVLAAERDRPRGTLDAVGVEFDPAIVEEPQQPLAVAERVADRLRHGAARRQPWQRRLQPDEQLLGQRTAPRLAFGQTPLGRVSGDMPNWPSGDMRNWPPR